MPISWNEIRHNAIRFAREWSEELRENAEAKSFWDEFFAVFGMRRRTVASFEHPVLSIRGTYGFIDLFWPGMMLVEHKSRGQSLDKAELQAFTYIQDLAREGKQDQLPRYVLVSDFARIALYDLEPEDPAHAIRSEGMRYRWTVFPLSEFHHNIQAFAFIPGYKQHRFEDQDPINIEAVQILGNLHDTLDAGGYHGHALERFLVRVLFCLFAEDTGLFERESFRLYLENRTAPDGSDLGLHLAQLFEVLNTPSEQRQTNLDEMLAGLPYVNGALFAERLGFAAFTRPMRNALLACTRFDWSKISPAVFGSLFQAVMEPKERRQMGGHYTSERDILKIVRSLFFDDLRAEFERVRNNRTQLKRFHDKLGSLRFFDPACGCGNFLVLTYRELRQLEIDVLTALHQNRRGQAELDIHALSIVDVDAFYGIELQEWPARIAEVAMWLMDHQMNLRLSEAFGQYFVRLPLRKSAHITNGNALRLDWAEVLPPSKCSYVLGNPPFVGAKFQTPGQRADMALVTQCLAGAGLLDYVTGWYFKAAAYIRKTSIRVGFVSTNSISQGEQVGVLWNELFRRGLRIHFAHRTFPWESEARGKAHVHVVIIGFGWGDAKDKRLYEYENGDVIVSHPRNIAPYLVEGPNAAIVNRGHPLCEVPEIGIGNKPIDGGNYLFTSEEKEEFLRIEPQAAPFFRPWVGSDEFINGYTRWCLWLRDCTTAQLRTMPEARKRIQAVRKFRLASKSAPTRKIAERPTHFHVENMPSRSFLVIPKVSSEERAYIPMGFVSPETLVSDLCFILPSATLFHFGVLTSAMHMAWVRHVCGRLKSDFRYSAKLVYNNFPWPAAPTDKQRARVELTAGRVLDVRASYLGGWAESLADLYEPLLSPTSLLQAHNALNRAVDRCYRAQSFKSDTDRISFLFELYDKYTTALIPASHPGPKRRR
jgi:hypothetical protein